VIQILKYFLSLQRRFQQTHEDVSYTVLALLPTLSEQILQTMDLELLTNELQIRSKSRNKLPPLAFPTEGDGCSVASTGFQPPHSRSLTPSASAPSSLAESQEGSGDKGGVFQAAVRMGSEPSVNSLKCRDIQPTDLTNRPRVQSVIRLQ